MEYDSSKVKITLAEEDLIEGFIRTTGGQVWFKITGTDKEKTSLLLLHGGPGACSDYFEPLSKLSRERPVIFYDQLGCGNSEKPGDMSLYSVENYVREVGEVRGALELSEVHILGQSWGGGLAAVYAASGKANGIKSLVLSSPLLDTNRWIDDQKSYLSELPGDVRENIRIAEETKDYDSKGYRDAMDLYYSLHLCRLNPWPDILVKSFEKTSAEVYMYMWGPSEFTCTGTLKSFNLSEELKRIEMPVLFICGEYDEAKPSSMEYFRKFVKNSEIVVIKNASHMAHLEKKDEYLGALRRFTGTL
ncbi:proline iminopeptidase [Methanomicrobium sp. W14]|uniref:proline iminopeptidase-family hydrolase n=1 Tax=Methanomicrobium sp. W14 TaxID=2817839 RepID=UPI001AEB4DDC|nr:proline iminopeptidase-family hydrolase [Methanomicrobium sp. W14]MBP2134021.1 proline iminopeptidase [Methanomicrobium sp. W14]